MPAPTAKPPGISSIGEESSPTSVDGAVRFFGPVTMGGNPPYPPEAPSGEESITVVDADRGAGDRFPEASSALGALDGGDFDARYRLGEAIGRGGMGEVHLATDTWMNRTVAVKLIRPDSAKCPRLRARFLFEARMQGQLEHPSIVPVYDLGTRPDGSEYFTMRRVRGRTLHEVLKDLREGEDPAMRRVAFTRRRLLAAFQSVCLAVELAHQRGVIHRDLKPANVMLGEFGEVIVLDWGLAKLRERDRASCEGAPFDEVRALDTTGVGEVLGSPGYMSPEQAVDSQSVGPESDVFALGATLFDILTLRRLVTGESNAAVTRNTIAGDYDARISRRFPELGVPPELEAICVRATAHDPRQRYERARDLADAVGRYLEGDRDVTRRRAISGEHTREAMAAFAESVASRCAEEAHAARARAIREVNHALAIDPQSQTALRIMMKIMTEMPAVIAPEAEAEVRASETRSLRTAARRGSFAYLAVTANLALMSFLGVVSLPALGVACACFLGAAAVTAAAARTSTATRMGRFIAGVIVLSSCGIAASSMLFGPLVLVPSMAAANVVVFAAGVGRRYRFLALACGLAAILAPLALELAGVLPPGWVLRDGSIAIVPRAVRFPPRLTEALLALASLGTVLFPALLVGAERDARLKAERELVLRSQTLAELVPAEAGEALSMRRPSWSMAPPPPAPPGGG